MNVVLQPAAYVIIIVMLRGCIPETSKVYTYEH